MARVIDEEYLAKMAKDCAEVAAEDLKRSGVKKLGSSDETISSILLPHFKVAMRQYVVNLDSGWRPGEIRPENAMQQLSVQAPGTHSIDPDAGDGDRGPDAAVLRRNGW